MLRSIQRNPEVDRVLAFLTNYIQAAGMQLEFRWAFDPQGEPSSDGADHQAVLRIDFTGPDVPLLLDRRAELLNALEHLAAKLLGLDPEQHHRIRLDAGNVKRDRDRELDASFTDAIAEVHRSGHPFRFPPMNSRERRMLHLHAAAADLRSASSGDGPLRSVTLYPLTPNQPSTPHQSPTPPTNPNTPNQPKNPNQPNDANRTAKLRETFRRR